MQWLRAVAAVAAATLAHGLGGALSAAQIWLTPCWLLQAEIGSLRAAAGTAASDAASKQQQQAGKGVPPEVAAAAPVPAKMHTGSAHTVSEAAEPSLAPAESTGLAAAEMEGLQQELSGMQGQLKAAHMERDKARQQLSRCGMPLCTGANKSLPPVGGKVVLVCIGMGIENEQNRVGGRTAGAHACGPSLAARCAL